MIIRLREHCPPARRGPRGRGGALFGSLARGDARPGSDADLFVLLTDDDGSVLDRTIRLLPYFDGVGVGCEMVAYTEGEWESLQREGRRIVRDVDADAIVSRGVGISGA
jgi:predicted nucleotidyltransferase